MTLKPGRVKQKPRQAKQKPKNPPPRWIRNLPKDLMSQVKARCAIEDNNLGEWLSEAIREKIERDGEYKV